MKGNKSYRSKLINTRYGIVVVVLSLALFSYYYGFMAHKTVLFDPLEHVSEVINSMQHRSMSLQPYKEDEGVIFVKTHKTASSTMVNILWRNLCENGKKNCFLPPSNNPGRTWDTHNRKDKE